VLVPWHLGAEPFTFAAVAYGTSPDSFDLVVPGEPRDRRLLFPVALELARWFNELFEAPWADRSLVVNGDYRRELASDAPQVWVPNDGAVTVLGKLGRRLAYLPTEERPDGPPPADPVLVRFGRHLQFLASHASSPGQQLVLAATSFAGDNWMTEQTVAERGNLAALDAWIEPPHGMHGFEAASHVEEVSVGPLPPPLVEDEVARLIDSFNEARRAENRPAMTRAVEEQRSLYREQSEPAWNLTWRVMARERAWPEESRFVPRRWHADIDAYSGHMAWMDGPTGGRRRTRQTVRQAIRARAQAEETQALLEAQEAVSDPIRMIPYLLDHKALEGTVVGYDEDHLEVKAGNKRASKVPIAELRTTRPCLIPVGKELWWTEHPDRVCLAVHSVVQDPDGPGSIVELKVMEHLKDARGLPSAPQPVCLSQLTTATRWSGPLPDRIPWTHRGPDPDEVAGSLEEGS
jgi:hypothetical protein